jgi:hypothetical protein
MVTIGVCAWMKKALLMMVELLENLVLFLF